MSKIITVDISENDYKNMTLMLDIIKSEKIDGAFKKRFSKLLRDKCLNVAQSNKLNKYVLNTEGRRHQHVMVEYNNYQESTFLKGYLIKLIQDLEKMENNNEGVIF